MASERHNLLLYAAILIVLTISMTVLIYLQAKFAADRDANIRTLHEPFTVELLQTPDYPVLNSSRWQRLELLANTVEMSPVIRRLIVTKYRQQHGQLAEVCIHPWRLASVQENWLVQLQERVQLGELERREISDGDQVVGALYFEPEDEHIRKVRMAAWGMGAMLAITLLIIASRLWAQQQVISATQIELAEKRNELIRLERLALAGQLTANIFHDIKKPVLNIKHEIVDVEESLKDLAGAIKPLQSIRTQVELFIDMLRDLNLERFVRANDQDAEFVDVNDLLERAVQLVKYEQGDVTVEGRQSQQLPFVFALPYRLIQVFSNIILNAYQAMEGAGQLTLATRQTGEWVEVLIADSGPGMEAKQLEQIFEPFYSTREAKGGSGLGLYISKEIVTIMGGEISVESDPGQGTIFLIRLKAAAPEDKGRSA